MATAKKTQVIITANAAVAKKVMDELQQRIDALKAKMKALDVTTDAGKKEYKKLEKELVSYNSAVTQNITNTERVQHAIRNLSNTSLKDLRLALIAAKKELGKMSESSSGLSRARQNVKTLQDQIDKLTGSVHRQGGAWQTALKNLTAYVGLFGAFNMIKSKLTDILRLNFQYSDSLANVRKVSNLSMDSVNELSKALAKVDSRTSLEGLTNLAYVGSRMGMAKYGVQGLYEFAKASDRVNVALKEDLGDDAMLTLSKFVETMGEVEKHGGNVSAAFDDVSSSIFKLASTSTANGNNILEFAKRLTGLSKVSHITSDQLLGLASASDSLMLMPEVASTAFGKLISSLWTNYHEIEKMLGMQEDSLKGMMEKGQTMQALVTVLEHVSSKNLSSMDEYFKEFGSEGQRLKSVVVTMAQNVNVLKDHLKESNEAYRDGTAVSKEYAIQQQTAQAILERANNMWEKAFVNPEGIDSVKEIAKVWYNFSKTLTQSQPFLASVKILMWELKVSVEAVLKILPALTACLGTRGLVWAFQKLIPLITGFKLSGIATFFSLLTASIKGSHIATLRLIVSWKQLNLAMKANVIGFVLSIFVSLGTYIYDLVKKTDDATQSMKKFDSSLRSVYRAANQSVGELDAYYRAIKSAKKGSLEYQAAMKTYNDKFGVYFKKLDKENGMVKDLAKSYRAAANAIRSKIYLQMKENDIKTQVAPRLGWALDKLDDYGKIAPTGFGRERLQGYEQDNRKTNMTDIIKDLAKRYGVKDLTNVLRSEKNGWDNAYRPVKKVSVGLAHSGTTVENVLASRAEQQLFKAIRYIRQQRSANNYKNAVEHKFAPVQKGIDWYLMQQNGDSNEDLNLGGGNTGKGGKTGSGKTDKGGNTDNKEKSIAKDRANALVANIKAFYEEQKRKYLEWVTQMNADGEKISEGQQKQMIDYLDTRMQMALGTAKQSIATLNDGWAKYKQTMDEDVMVFDDETSKNLLESIGNSDIKELHNLFEKLSGDLSRENNKSLSENLGALLGEIFANGTAAMREAAEKLIAHQREIQKILNENDYTGAVNRSTRSNFDTLGFLKPAKEVNADTSQGLEQMNKAFDKLATKARNTLSTLYQLNPESDTFRQSFLDYLSVANDGFDFTLLKTQDLKALYIELIKYTDNYTEAQKREYDTAKKIADASWATHKRNLADQEKIRKIQQESAMFGKRTNLLSNLGLANLTADPEVELMKARMQAAENYYEYVKANSKNQQLIDEAERARQQAELAYANQVASAMKDRLAQMRELVQPIQTFGGEVGKAFAEMRNDVSGAQEAIKNALKSMLESWGNMALNDVNTQMWKAINDAGAKRGKKKAQPEIEAARANAHAEFAKDNISDLGTQTNPMYVRLVDKDAPYLTQQPQSNFEGMATQQPIGWNPDGSPIMSKPSIVPPYAPTDANGQPINNDTSDQNAGAPRAWKHRNRDNANTVYTDVANQTGSAIADAATGNGSFTHAAVGIGGGLIGDVLNMDFNTGSNVPAGGNGAADSSGSSSDKKDEKNKKAALKREKKHQKDLNKEIKQGIKDREKTTDKGVKNMTDITDEGNKDQKKSTELTQKGINTLVDTGLNLNITKQKAANAEQLQNDADTTQAQMTFSIAGAIGKCFSFLGPIAGPIAAAVVMATLTGLMQWALSSAFGSKKKSSSSSTNTKLVTGMLTYDSGNVQDLKPFVADNGEVYWAKEDNAPQQSGVQMLNTPTATTINGQPSLVAEKGPEIVIGRETTHAMMMNNPGLLKALVNYDQNYSGRNSARRAFDNGNVGEALAASVAAGNGNLSSGANATDDMIAASTASNAALMQAVNALLDRLSKPIQAKINMYGHDGLYEDFSKANQFMKGKR